MGNSLRDALLKVGLVDETQAKQARHDKRRQAKKQRSSKPAPPPPAIDPAAAEKAKRDRELNRQIMDKAAQKALTAEIKQIITAHRLPKNDGEIAYNFTDGSKIKRLYVSEETQRQLGSGAAVIVKLHGQYDIVPKAAADKIRQRDSGCVVESVADQKDNGQDDPYADFPIPDDMTW